MTAINLTVNGTKFREDVAPRLHLADFLRERLLLTGTHLGCEHGVCGACTLLIDGEPARSCITSAAACDGTDIRTIEGLEDDAIAIRLRVAFTAHHALQCGYCTPGMLVTACDIVQRLPNATDDDIRLELAGNLCRCTGYNGIIRAIRQVLDERLPLALPPRAPLPSQHFGVATPAAATQATAPSGQGLHPRLNFAAPPQTLWRALRDPAIIVSCVPGATLAAQDGNRITAQMQVALGPIRARFTGDATMSYDDTSLSGRVQGGGQDQSSGTRLAASATFQVHPDQTGSLLQIDIDYTLRGALAQLAKQRVIALLADEIAATFARNLSARLAGQESPQAGPLSALRLFALWLRSLFKHGTNG